MDNWDASYIQNKFNEVNGKLTLLEKSVSNQTNLLERKLEDLSNKISTLQKQNNNGNIKLATFSGLVSAALFEAIQFFGK